MQYLLTKNIGGIGAPLQAFVGRQADLTEFSTKTREKLSSEFAKQTREATVGCGEWSAVSAEVRKA